MLHIKNPDGWRCLNLNLFSFFRYARAAVVALLLGFLHPHVADCVVDGLTVEGTDAAISRLYSHFASSCLLPRRESCRVWCSTRCPRKKRKGNSTLGKTKAYCWGNLRHPANEWFPSGFSSGVVVSVVPGKNMTTLLSPATYALSYWWWCRVLLHHSWQWASVAVLVATRAIFGVLDYPSVVAANCQRQHTRLSA